MKKQVWSMAALALLLTTASCTDEQWTGGMSGGESMVTFNAKLPKGLQTKAIGDGLTATTLSYAVYAQDSQTPLITSKDEVTFEDGQATLSLRLAAGKSYDFLFWADAYDKDDTDAPYTVDFDTQELNVDYTKALSNEEARDAFFGKATVEVKGAVNQDITLKRPFAQLNIGTNDMAEAQKSGLNTNSLKTSVKVNKIYKTLNLMSGEVGGDAEVTFAANAIPKATFTANGKSYDYLALNYLLVGTDKALVNCEFTYSDGTLNNTMTMDNVPVQRNYRTNIFGSLLTGSVDFDITIDPDFEATDHNYAELLLAAQNGGTVTLTDNVTLTAPLTIAQNASVTIDLNGKTLKNSSTSTALNVYGSLVINGEGTVDGGQGGNNVTVWVQNGANVTINGGTFTVGPDANNTGNSCIYSTGGTVTINGGTFESKAAYNGKYYVLNLQNGSGGKITCTGGTFKNYNPAEGDDHDQPTNFVANGYSSVKIDDEPTPNGTYRVVKGTGAASSSDISSALASGAELITLAADVTIDPTALSSIKSSTIDLNEQTLTFGSTNTLYIPKGGNLTFQNGKIVADGFEDIKTILIANEGSSLTLENVKIKTTGTGIGPANCASNVTITIKNSELNCGAYGFATNASMPVGDNNKFILEDSKFSASEPVFINIPCEVTMNNCTLNGTTHGMILRGGKATVSNSTITLTYTDDDYATIGSYFDYKNWGSGNMLNIAALTVGNKSTGYQYPSELTLQNTKVISAGSGADYLPALYAYANQGEGLGVTITYDNEENFTGDIVYGSKNIMVNGKEAEITTKP